MSKINNSEPALTRFRDTMLNTVGHRETERALQLGHLYRAEEALKVGLVDRLCPEDQVVKEAEEEMSRWLRVNGQYLLFNFESQWSVHNISIYS